MEVISWWHDTLQLVTRAHQEGTTITVTIENNEYQLEVLRWHEPTGELVCRLDNTIYRWRRLTPPHETPATWYSYAHDATLVLHTQRPRTKKSTAANSGSTAGPLITSPLAGRVIRVLAKEKATVEAQTPLVVIEAMKMENEIRAPYDGFIETVFIKPEDMVEVGQSLITLNRKE